MPSTHEGWLPPHARPTHPLINVCEAGPLVPPETSLRVAVSQRAGQAGQWGRPGPGHQYGCPASVGLPSLPSPLVSCPFPFLSPNPVQFSFPIPSPHVVYFYSWLGAMLGSSEGLRLGLQHRLLKREH